MKEQLKSLPEKYGLAYLKMDEEKLEEVERFMIEMITNDSLRDDNWWHPDELEYTGIWLYKIILREISGESHRMNEALFYIQNSDLFHQENNTVHWNGFLTPEIEKGVYLGTRSKYEDYKPILMFENWQETFQETCMLYETSPEYKSQLKKGLSKKEKVALAFDTEGKAMGEYLYNQFQDYKEEIEQGRVMQEIKRELNEITEAFVREFVADAIEKNKWKWRIYQLKCLIKEKFYPRKKRQGGTFIG